MEHGLEQGAVFQPQMNLNAPVSGSLENYDHGTVYSTTINLGGGTVLLGWYLPATCQSKPTIGSRTRCASCATGTRLFRFISKLENTMSTSPSPTDY